MRKSQPIRIQRPSSASKIDREDSGLSQSLGALQKQSIFRQRHLSDVSSISYAGYLLKRSNLPQTTLTPFPASEQSLPELLPPLQLQPKLTALEDYTTTVPQLPQHLLVPDRQESIPQSVSSSEESADSKFERTMAFAAAFLGVDWLALTSKKEPKQPKTSPFRDNAESDSFSHPRRRASLPIPMSKSNSNLSLSSASSATPEDQVDADGHLWRAKYCVLENGILYFYRYQSDAEAPEAHAERQQHALSLDKATSPDTSSPSPSFLAQSPMPNKALIDTNRYTWEKFVALSMVGAVRSAEAEYGSHSLELSAMDDDDGEKLILKARNAFEMNEWLFQFHMAIASYIEEIMESASNMSNRTPGLHSYKPTSISIDTSGSPDRHLMAAFSPRYWPKAQTAALSHGHGRNSLHRRRIQPPGASLKASSFHDRTSSPIASFPMLPTTGSLRMTSSSGSSAHGRFVTPTPRQLEVESPELSAPISDYPEMERPPPSNGKYVPPALRHRQEGEGSQYVPPALRRSQDTGSSQKYVPPRRRQQQQHTGSQPYVPARLRQRPSPAMPTATDVPTPTYESDYMSFEAASMVDQGDGAGVVPVEEPGFPDDEEVPKIKIGGCADPNHVAGSILDDVYIPRKASKLGKVRSDPFGYIVGHNEPSQSRLRWEIGSVSECGVRNSNEDAYVIVGDLLEAFNDYGIGRTVWEDQVDHSPSLFVVLDGHCGDQAARFVAERLVHSIHTESFYQSDVATADGHGWVKDILQRSIAKLDSEFCRLCIEEGREWESGTTAVIAALVDDHLVIANLGDARGVICRSVAEDHGTDALEADGWKHLPSSDYHGRRRCLYKEVAEVHSPARPDERERIERANGWITTEEEIPVGQLHRMAFFDEDVVDILKRCFADRFSPSPKAAAPHRILQISRVCGELAVSRAIGDRDFKAACNLTAQDPYGGGNCEWDSALFLPYPDDHSRSFVGDLVSNQAEFKSIRVGEYGATDEFLLLACDGLWDVMDPDDAVRLTRDLLFEKRWPAKQAANRLAELAVHLGSSDNITVIVVRFFDNN